MPPCSPNSSDLKCRLQRMFVKWANVTKIAMYFNDFAAVLLDLWYFKFTETVRVVSATKVSDPKELKKGLRGKTIMSKV